MAEYSSEAKAIVHGIIAEGKLSDLKSYLERGRLFEDLTEAELEEVWIDAVKVWSDGPFRPSVGLNDLDAEYSMRKLKPPFDRAAADIEKAIAAIDARTEAMSVEERADANAAMVTDYLKNSGTPN